MPDKARHRCEYFDCPQTFVGELPTGWSQYGESRFYPRQSKNRSIELPGHTALIRLATWCPQHSTNNCAVETDLMVERLK